jgi:hypothetical protein
LSRIATAEPRDFDRLAVLVEFLDTPIAGVNAIAKRPWRENRLGLGRSSSVSLGLLSQTRGDW